MSTVEYNCLIYEIRERLDELDVGKKLIFMCRGKVAPGREENMQDASSLITELEEKESLGPDNLDLLKDLLKGVKEWALLEEVEKFESKRTEYYILLNQIIRALDELNDLERLVSICGRKIPRERQGNIRDVRSLFEELENNHCLGINRLDILKEILAQTEKNDLLMAVKEFEERRTRKDKFERRIAQATAIVSVAGDKLTGVLNIKTVFKVAAGGIFIAGAFELLRRGSTYDQLVTAINNCVLPAGTKLIEMAKGSVNLKVHAENLLALENLWRMYKNGTLKAGLQALFVTDEMKEFASGEQVEVVVTIDEQEYIKARNELITESKADPFGEERLKFIDQEKYEYIQNYLDQAREQTKDVDSHSLTTDTSDSGMLGSNSASSEVGAEDTSDFVSKLCLKDITEEMTKELTFKLKSDQDTLDRFYRSFGLDPTKLRTEELVDIKDIFPDTPVKMLKDVFEALQLYDLAELLERAANPRTLRPALSLKDIEKLPRAENRPPKIFTKAEVLIIDCSNRCDAGDNPQNFGAFFRALNPKSQVVEVAVKAAVKMCQDLEKLKEIDRKQGDEFYRVERTEATFKQCLKEKKPVGCFGWWGSINETPHLNTNEELLSMFQKQESAIKEGLEKLVAEKEQLSKETIQTSREAMMKEEELQAEHENIESAVSTCLNKWIEQAHDKGNESTLFVVFFANRFNYQSYRYDYIPNISDLVRKIEGCLKEKLPLIPHTKFVIINDSPTQKIYLGEIPSETLQVHFPERIGLGAMVELLNKRYKSLDLIAAMLELKRKCLKTSFQKTSYGYIVWHSLHQDEFDVRENLSCLPRLQKVEQI